MEDPGYYPLFANFNYKEHMLSVPRMLDGPDMEVLEQHLRLHKPKLFFIQSVGHNPTGSDISPSKAHRLVQMAEEHNFILVDDDAFWQISNRHRPSRRVGLGPAEAVARSGVFPNRSQQG